MNLKRICLNCMLGEITPSGVCSVCGKTQLTHQVPSCALPLETIVHGRYLVGGVLGQGGFGITYVSYDLVENRRVVLKELFPSFAVRRMPGQTEVSVYKNAGFFEKSRERFIQEAQMIYTFRSTPEIVDVYHIFIENNTGYYIMEYLNGQTLQHLLKQSGNLLPWEQMIPIVGDVTHALSVVHQNGSIHRDISPDNIFLTESGKTKLIDFGAARHFSSGKEMTEILKKGFAPWEQYHKNGKQGPWTDIYALAATIYLCLTGHLPPDAPARALQDTLQPLSAYGVTVPKPIEAALMQALAIRSEARFQSVDAFADALGIPIQTPLLLQRTQTEHHPASKAERPTLSAGQWCVRGVRGQYAGVHIPFRSDIVIGRDPRRCTLVYPAKAPGISAVQLSLLLGDGVHPGIRCESTSQVIYVNGVMFSGRGRVEPLKSGDRISFGNNQIFIVERVK